MTQITNYNNSALVNINYNIYLNSKKEELKKKTSKKERMFNWKKVCEVGLKRDL